MPQRLPSRLMEPSSVAINSANEFISRQTSLLNFCFLELYSAGAIRSSRPSEQSANSFPCGLYRSGKPFSTILIIPVPLLIPSSLISFSFGLMKGDTRTPIPRIASSNAFWRSSFSSFVKFLLTLTHSLIGCRSRRKLPNMLNSLPAIHTFPLLMKKSP